MIGVNRVVIPSLLCVLGVTFLIFGAVLIAFGAEEPEYGQVFGEGEGENATGAVSKRGGLSLKQERPDLTTVERCSSRVNWTGLEERPAPGRHRDHWECIRDYESELQFGYTLLGVLYAVVAPVACCVGGLHYLADGGGAGDARDDDQHKKKEEEDGKAEEKRQLPQAKAK